MNKTDHLKRLAQLDLNLLVVFKAIEEHRHVTRAASSLGISQSAVSHALGRLRQTFDDELYVKTPRGMVPTPRANALSPSVEELISALGEVFLGQEEFSPEKIHRVFRVQTTDLIEHLLLPSILKLQKDEAPGAQVSFRNVEFSLPKEALEEGTTDLAIAGFFGDLPDGFYKQKLFADSFRCCVRKDHPKVKGRMTQQVYCALPHILIAPGGELTGQVDKVLARQKVSRQVAVGTSGFLAAGWAVARSDAVLTAPAKLIQGFEEYLPIRSFEVPFELSQITIVQVWHERQHRDPGHKWFREHFAKVFA